MTPQNSNPIFQMIGAVAPALVDYTQERIIDELWNRPGLTVRERAIATLSTLIARNATNAYRYYFIKALDCGLRPSELSELMTHLACYASFPYTFGAIAVLKDIFVEREIVLDEFPDESQACGAEKCAYMPTTSVPFSEALQHFTADLLEAEIWHRPGLALRDRTLATFCAVAAQGNLESLAPFVSYAQAQGISRQALEELLAHTAFYAGWAYANRVAIFLNGAFRD
ncbi:carboxymuconolactone decarboxylase family protein [Pseudomonas sp. MWU12-2345]|uniref:carboxymuconolactone decarboxylase family protein n=1 Tax=Pseudomonas sp. MWU12-2345 TaxID=2928689 RepID=UPI00200F0A8B|nr:carboxymuconolactone decarboxylase family protein [Pseudomonas sp. MWU12-2345]